MGSPDEDGKRGRQVNRRSSGNPGVVLSHAGFVDPTLREEVASYLKDRLYSSVGDAE